MKHLITALLVTVALGQDYLLESYRPCVEDRFDVVARRVHLQQRWNTADSTRVLLDAEVQGFLVYYTAKIGAVDRRGVTYERRTYHVFVDLRTGDSVEGSMIVDIVKRRGSVTAEWLDTDAPQALIALVEEEVSFGAARGVTATAFELPRELVAVGEPWDLGPRQLAAFFGSHTDHIQIDEASHGEGCLVRVEEEDECLYQTLEQSMHLQAHEKEAERRFEMVADIHNQARFSADSPWLSMQSVGTVTACDLAAATETVTERRVQVWRTGADDAAEPRSLHVWPEGNNARQRDYSITTEVRGGLFFGAQSQRREASGGLDYRFLTTADRSVALTLQRTCYEDVVDGALVAEFDHGRDYVRAADAQGERYNHEFATAPREVRRKMYDLFRRPRYELLLDAFGRVMERKFVGKGLAAGLEEGMEIETVLLVHPPFLAGSPTWSNRVRFSYGSEGLAEGYLFYRRGAPVDEGLAPVSVMGVLTLHGSMEHFDQTRTTLEVTGQQYWDTQEGSWHEALLDLQREATYHSDNVLGQYYNDRTAMRMRRR